jgi:hypothetical protein
MFAAKVRKTSKMKQKFIEIICGNVFPGVFE